MPQPQPQSQSQPRQPDKASGGGGDTPSASPSPRPNSSASSGGDKEMMTARRSLSSSASDPHQPAAQIAGEDTCDDTSPSSTSPSPRPSSAEDEEAKEEPSRREPAQEPRPVSPFSPEVDDDSPKEEEGPRGKKSSSGGGSALGVNEDLWDSGQEWILIFDRLLKHPRGRSRGCKCDMCLMDKGADPPPLSASSVTDCRDEDGGDEDDLYFPNWGFRSLGRSSLRATRSVNLEARTNFDCWSLGKEAPLMAFPNFFSKAITQVLM